MKTKTERFSAPQQGKNGFAKQVVQGAWDKCLSFHLLGSFYAHIINFHYNLTLTLNIQSNNISTNILLA